MSAITIGEVAPEPVVASEPVTVNPVIVLPPVIGAVNAIEFWLTPAVAVGAVIVAGTVVAVAAEDVVETEDPAAFVATTVNV